MNLSNTAGGLKQGMFVATASANHALGQRGVTADGRVYRYCLNGAVALVAGNVIQSPATPGGQLAKAVHTTTPTGVGSLSINLTCGSSVAAGFYADGYLVTASGAGQGYVYTIASHAAVSTGATGVFQLYTEDSVVVAITNTSTVSLIPNKYSGVIQAPVTTATGVIVGVAAYAIGITQYGWIQTWGPCAVLGEDTTAIGAPVDGIASTAGRVRAFTGVSSIGTIATEQLVGYLMQANVAAQWVMVDLRIAP